ncbi:MAG: hypothetical protein V4510_04710 [bacterium]
MLRAVPFDPTTILDIVASHYKEKTGKEVPHPLRTRSRCAGKRQLAAIIKHVASLDCRVIVIEDPYVDRDFLEDFSAYYGKAYRHYPRYCRRLHFFSHPVTEATFQDFLDKDEPTTADVLQSGYLGFTVLRPLPGTFIGRTCLRPGNDGANRFHSAFMRPYEVNLAGRQFRVDALAFQEQDRTVAACATSAVWTALHKAGLTFGVKVPTPSEITHLAMRDGPRRALPSDGLTVPEISHAIRRSGLEVEIRDRVLDLKALAHGYGQFGIPIILGLDLFQEHGNSNRRLGMHAVTVTGFATTDKGPAGESFSDRITGFYFHDDQAGPYCHGALTLRHEKHAETGEDLAFWVLDTDFPTARGKVVGVVQTVIIPVDDMIRIQYEDAERMAAAFRHVLLPVVPAGMFEWEIRLCNVNEARSVIGRKIPGPHRARFLQRNLPRFMWRVTARHQGQPTLDLVLDGTDIRRAFFVTDLIIYDAALREAVAKYIAVAENRKTIEDTSEWGADWLATLEKA